MNMPAMYQDEEVDYRSEHLRSDREKFSRRRKQNYARGGNRPMFHNGIHRRRNKRFSW